MTTPQTALAPERRRDVLRQSWSVGWRPEPWGEFSGALSVAAGLDVLQTQALSTLMFTGGSQFAFVGIIAAGGLAAARCHRDRRAARSAQRSLCDPERPSGVRGLRRVAAAQLTIDESTAVGIAQPEPAAQRLGFWHTGIAVFLFWNLATLAGSLLGNALGDPRRWGLDAAAAAAFCALLWPRLRGRDPIATAVLAIFIALLSAPFVPAGVPVILSAVAAPGRRPGRVRHSAPRLAGSPDQRRPRASGRRGPLP